MDVEIGAGKQMTKCIMGIDPGASGALAFWFPDFPNKIGVFDFPLIDGEINCAAMADIVRTHNPDLCIIEAVGPMPKQGVSSTFKFGVAYGMARGVIACLAIPQIYVSPTKWKKHYGLLADKEKAREMAITLWPASEAFRRKKDHGRAEAALLARYGSTVLR